MKVFKDILKELNSSVDTYYMVKTDDSVRAIGGASDKHFELWDVNSLSKYIANFELHNIRYWVEIEMFNSVTFDVLNRITLIDKTL